MSDNMTEKGPPDLDHKSSGERTTSCRAIIAGLVGGSLLPASTVIDQFLNRGRLLRAVWNMIVPPKEDGRWRSGTITGPRSKLFSTQPTTIPIDSHN